MQAEKYPCHRQWLDEEGVFEASLWISFGETDWSEAYVTEPEVLEIEGPDALYHALLFRAAIEKTGGEFWGPREWVLQVSGEEARIDLTCGHLRPAPDRAAAETAQESVDTLCLPLLKAVKVGDLGPPLAIQAPHK